MKNIQKISVYPFLITGLLVSTLLAMLIPHRVFDFLPFLPGVRAHASWRMIFYRWTSLYGIMFLLAYPNKKSLTKLILTTLVVSFIAMLPYHWGASYSFAQLILITTAAYALTAFHIHYQSNQLKWHYPTLFLAVWDSFIKLFTALCFILFCWIILLLCGTLFKLIGITFIDQLTNKNWFQVWFSTLMISIGLWIATQSTNAIFHVRSILFYICKYLFITVAIIGIFFIVAALIKTMQHDVTLNNLSAFLSFALLSIIFLNGVYRDGLSPLPYSTFFIMLCRIFLWLSPVFSGLALHALYQYNIHLHGLTTQNFPYLICTLLLLTYNMSYAIIAFCPRKTWLKPIERINITLGFLLIITALITTNPAVLKLASLKNTML